MLEKFFEDVVIDGVKWNDLEDDKKKLVVSVFVAILIGIFAGVFNMLFAKSIFFKFLGFVIFGLILASVKISKKG